MARCGWYGQGLVPGQSHLPLQQRNALNEISHSRLLGY